MKRYLFGIVVLFLWVLAGQVQAKSILERNAESAGLQNATVYKMGIDPQFRPVSANQELMGIDPQFYPATTSSTRMGIDPQFIIQRPGQIYMGIDPQF